MVNSTPVPGETTMISVVSRKSMLIMPPPAA
jgi:hypothetical protein